MELWQWHCQNRREKKLLQLVCGNGIAQIEGKKKKWQLICGNGIAEIEERERERCLNIKKSTHILIF